jgi:hypothetical protein
LSGTAEFKAAAVRLEALTVEKDKNDLTQSILNQG